MKTIFIAPHPDDEVLGVGGTILRRKSEGAEVALVLVTSPLVADGWSDEFIRQKNYELQKSIEFFNFDEVYKLNFPTTRLDQVPIRDIVDGLSHAFNSFKPVEVFFPHSGDVHSDHRVVFDAVQSCIKWFRHPTILRALTYETLSETDFNTSAINQFVPNVFIDIEKFLESKLDALDGYSTELGQFPFPRSRESVRALALIRGAASGFAAAEAFALLRERS